LISECTHHPTSSRLGEKRADTQHSWLDLIIVGGAWILSAGLIWIGARTIVTST